MQVERIERAHIKKKRILDILATLKSSFITLERQVIRTVAYFLQLGVVACTCNLAT